MATSIKSIKVNFASDNGTFAPVYAKYDVQNFPQPAFIRVESKVVGSFFEVELIADYKRDVSCQSQGDCFRIHAVTSRDFIVGLETNEDFRKLLSEYLECKGEGEDTDDASFDLDSYFYGNNIDVADVGEGGDWFAPLKDELVPELVEAGSIEALAKAYKDNVLDSDQVVFGMEEGIEHWVRDVLEDVEQEDWTAEQKRAAEIIEY